MNPDHREQIQRLNKIQGQVKGIVRMIEEKRYCIDILNQIKAIDKALQKVSRGVMERHLNHCVQGAIQAKDQAQSSEKIAEIMKLLDTQK